MALCPLGALVAVPGTSIAGAGEHVPPASSTTAPPEPATPAQPSTSPSPESDHDAEGEHDAGGEGERDAEGEGERDGEGEGERDGEGEAATAAPVPDGTVVLQAIGCDAWDEVPANFLPDALEPGRDHTDGRYRSWGPIDRQRVSPTADEAATSGCEPLDGVHFRLSGTEFGNGLTPEGEAVYDPSATSTTPGATGDDGQGTLDLTLGELSSMQRQSLVDDTGLWVEAVEADMPGTFANLRCHDDRYNADNLEVIRSDAGLEVEFTCVLYVINAAPAIPTISADPPVVPNPTLGLPVVADTAVPPAPISPAPISPPPIAPVTPEPAVPTVDPARGAIADPAVRPVEQLPPVALPAPDEEIRLAEDPPGSAVPDAPATAPTTAPAVVLPRQPAVDLVPTTTTTAPGGPTVTPTAPTSGPAAAPSPDDGLPAVVSETAAPPPAGPDPRLSVVTAAGLGAIFLVGLGLAVVAARRPL